MKKVICLIAIVTMVMNVQAHPGFLGRIFKTRESKAIVRVGDKSAKKVFKTGENEVKAGVSAKKIEAIGKGAGYCMAGGAAIAAAHSITSVQRAKGRGIDDWNRRMEEEFSKLPQEERKELMKDVIEKNFVDGWGKVIGSVAWGCLSAVVLLWMFAIWRKKRFEKPDPRCVKGE